jgi:hypothetical protein
MPKTKKQNWRCDSSSRVSALQAQSQVQNPVPQKKKLQKLKNI